MPLETEQDVQRAIEQAADLDDDATLVAVDYSPPVQLVPGDDTDVAEPPADWDAGAHTDRIRNDPSARVEGGE